jgi:hypothetical protein
MPVPVKLNLSKNQLNKLKLGGSIQIKHSDIGHGSDFHLNEPNVRKLVKK